MLAVLSPAKKLDALSPAPLDLASQPVFLDQAQTLVKHARTLSARDLCRLMKISERLGTLNAERFAAFTTPFTLANAKQAAFMFSGDTYVGLDAGGWSREDLEHAQSRVAILSGLYGVLRPADLIQPYRLEMGIRLATERGHTLYEFWADAIAQRLGEILRDHPAKVVVNLASQEYFKAVRQDVLEGLGGSVITPVFMEERADHPRVQSFFAKRARGMMARYMVQKRLEQPEALKQFTLGGYHYRPDMSSADRWVFTRPAGSAKEARA